jgi:hypothetical protein
MRGTNSTTTRQHQHLVVAGPVSKPARTGRRTI